MKNNPFTASRLRNNFYYTKGEIPVFHKLAMNSVIISDSEKGFIHGIDNHAVIKSNGKAKIIPIENIMEIFDASIKILNQKKIVYEKPFSISIRENLEPINLQIAKKIISATYGFEVLDLEEIKNKKGGYRIYKVVSEKRVFILKYCGLSLQKFRSKANVIKNSDYFPKIIPTTDGSNYMILNGNIYALEEFVFGTVYKGKPKEYFGKVGKYIALFHNEINSNIKEKTKKVLSNKKYLYSESNLVSSLIDLRHNSIDKNELFEEIRTMVEKKTLDNFGSLPSCIIHGDLNKSNIIWLGSDMMFIDYENIKYSKRINEFIPVLLLMGNFKNPYFNEKSVRQLIDHYNLISDRELTQLEIELLPEMLKLHAIKSYVIYCIRNNRPNKKYKKEMISNLTRIKKDFK